RPLTVFTTPPGSTFTAPITSTAQTVSTTSITPASTTSITPASTPSTTSSTSTPTTAVLWDQQTINSVAGKVVVSFRGEEVRLESVAPLAGYTYEVEKDGPDEVRVELEGPLRVEIRARIRDGQLTTEVNENS
ncbi:MAG TPA: hypothetical protein VM470_01420, partial [Acidimicrobiia bacterium]|nr:hypothetical protein [Acidimicrobiia bacterium]